jgi:hypothetical protein
MSEENGSIGSTSAPIGSEAVNTGVQTPSTNSGAPNTVDISDDTLVRGVPGFNEPVRYGDLYKRLQSDYTRKTQAAERLRQEAAADRARHSTEIANERKRLEGLAQTILQRQGQVQAPQYQTDPLFTELSQAKYIDGPSMGKFISAIQEKGFQPIVKAFQERDQIIQGMYTTIMQLQKQMKDFSSAKQSQDTEGKINRWLTEGGYPQEAKDLAKEIYSAYEGDDLDNEFPSIFEARWNQLQNLVRAADRKRVEDAKRSSTKLPGRGGMGTTSKPIGLKGHEKARDVAASLWDAIQVHESDT